MIKRIFIDSDIILDVATGREPFVKNSSLVLSIIENRLAIGVLSANSITNIYYILRKISSGEKAKIFLKTILQYFSVIPVNHNNIIQALESGFSDFEDAVQHFCALTNQCDYIVTRNINDYKKSEITVLEPKEFIAIYKKTT